MFHSVGFPKSSACPRVAQTSEFTHTASLGSGRTGTHTQVICPGDMLSTTGWRPTRELRGNSGIRDQGQEADTLPWETWDFPIRFWR